MTLFRRILAGALAFGWMFVVLPAVVLLLPDPASSTVNTAANKTIAAGNGSQTVFTFSFIGVAAQYITVTYTDSSGNQTVLTQGSGTTQYQITLNAPVQGAIWGAGGTITYNPSGTPIPSGSTLTILRTLPLTQAVSLSNQSSVQTLGKGAETGLDTDVMQGQQIAEQIGRALQMNSSNSAAPNPLPPAAQLANMGLCGDSTGNNVIACTLPSSGVISSAMQPVVNAASLAAGRTAFGLGSVAVENIGGAGQGLGDDGAGNLRIQTALAGDSTNQSVTSAFHTSVRYANSAGLVYTLPVSSTLFNGFWFQVNTLSGSATLAPNAADNFSGMSSGASLVIPQGIQGTVTTNGGGVWFINPVASGVSLNAPLNLQLSCSVATNALTCSVLDRNGNVPSTASAVLLAFRDSTSANGDPVARAITGSLSVTVPSGATLGTVNGQTNRIWIGAFDNAGTPVLGVYNSLNSSGPSILPWDETAPASGSGITSGSTSPQTWYTASSVTSISFRILGYVESTQSTAGTWASAPSKVQLFGPGVKRPGDAVQVQSATINAASTTTSATFVALASQQISITPMSAANMISVAANGTLYCGTNGATTAEPGALQLSRGTTAATNLIGNRTVQDPQSGVNTASPAVTKASSALAANDLPNTASSVTYAVQGAIPAGATLTYSNVPTFMSATEIQI
jgi:hypothetical protein